MGPKKTIARKVSRGTSSSSEPFDSTRYHTIENFKNMIPWSNLGPFGLRGKYI